MHARINHGDTGKGYETTVALATGVSLMKLNETTVSATDKLLKQRMALSFDISSLNCFSETGFH